MHIALASWRDLPDWEVDDHPLHEALRDRGVTFERPCWEDEGIDWQTFDAVLIRTPWNYQEKQPKFVAWAEHVAKVTRIFNPAQVVRWNTHKSYLRDLGAAGVRITPTLWLDRGMRANVGELMATMRWKRGFLKPMVGATARETLRFCDDNDGITAANAHCARLLPHEGLMLQPYREAVETEGELSLILIDGKPAHGVRKVPVPGDYRVQDDFDATDMPHTFTPAEADEMIAVVRAAERVLELAPGALLYARVDVLRSPEGTLDLNELELVEPSLFFRHAPRSAELLADALIQRVR
ncbi:MAG: RimK family alpha-L-glutamate ligase [Planctomycetota bacterium]